MNTKQTNFIVTIDGPCGAGKTTTAKALAKKLGAMYLDTGGLYRALAYAFIQDAFEPENATPETVAETARYMYDKRISVTYDDTGSMQFSLDENDITGLIRTEQISDMASRISTRPEIRAVIDDAARNLAKNTSIIAEGRDTGTCLFPDATARYYLNANLANRAKRRQLQTPEQFKSVLDAADTIESRDTRDMERTTAPLPKPNVAAALGLTVIENDGMTLDETIEYIHNDILARIR